MVTLLLIPEGVNVNFNPKFLGWRLHQGLITNPWRLGWSGRQPTKSTTLNGLPRRLRKGMSHRTSDPGGPYPGASFARFLGQLSERNYLTELFAGRRGLGLIFSRFFLRA